jgi:predicted TIM-barrel fold metal-dependent hydrolase
VERAPVADLHQHLFGPGTLELSPSLPRVVARDLIRLLDSAGIRRALVLSVAYQFSNPNRAPFTDEYARVKAENDWTAAQAAEFPDRLLAFCGVNPVRDYALEEIARCAADPRLRSGLKLHIGNSDVNFEDSVHLERVRAVFRAANANRMAIVLHLRPSVTRQRPYGERIARIFLTEVIAEAPDVPIQIAHMGGAGLLNDPPADEALEVFVKAIAENDARMRNVYFDVSGISGVGRSAEISARLATRIRQLGIRRILFGSDAAVRGNSPLFSLTAFRQVPLSRDEFTTIVQNVPPYLK